MYCINSITNMIQDISKLSITEKIAVSNLYMLQFHNFNYIEIIKKNGPGKLKNGKYPNIIYLPFIKNIYYTISYLNINIYYNELLNLLINSYSCKEFINIFNLNNIQYHAKGNKFTKEEMAERLLKLYSYSLYNGGYVLNYIYPTK